MATNDCFFTDLLSYAPGLNSSGADIQAVVEAEAAPALGNTPGTIAPEARRLIDRTAPRVGRRLLFPVDQLPRNPYRLRRPGPVSLTSAVAPGVARGSGLRWDHALAPVSASWGWRRADGEPVSSGGDASLVPVAAVAGRGPGARADLLAVDAHTVAIVPHTPRNDAVPEKDAVSYRQHLVFADDGRLVERQLVAMPGQSSARCTTARACALWMTKARSCFASRFSCPASAPDLKPNLADLVVLNLPLRSRNHVMTKLSLQPNFLLTHPNNAR